MAEDKHPVRGLGRELLPHAVWDAIREAVKWLWEHRSVLGMVASGLIAAWQKILRQSVDWWIIGGLFLVSFVSFIYTMRRTATNGPKEAASSDSLCVYLDDFQYGVRMLWLDKTFLFSKCRMVSTDKTTSIIGIQPSVITNDGRLWQGTLIEDLSAWYLTQRHGR